MTKFLITILHKLHLFDSLKIIKDKYFRLHRSKEDFKKRKKFYSQFINEGNLCFDVGANYGNRTEAFLALRCKVVAIEPQPKTYNFLKKKYGKKIILIDKALGSNSGEAILYLSSSSSLTSVSEEWINKVSNGRFSGSSWNRRIKVPMTTLDSLINEYGKPQFCKIDVEGYELEVIKGLSEPIDYISFEFTIPEFTEKAVEVIKYLDSLGNIKCNYSSGETLELGLESWLDPAEFIKNFNQLNSYGIKDGDIYIKFIPPTLNE